VPVTITVHACDSYCHKQALEQHETPHQGPFPVSGGGFRNSNRGSFPTTPWRWRWRWDLNPRWTFTHTRFRVLRTHFRVRLPAYVLCSIGPPVAVAEHSRTRTNETRTETKSVGASRARPAQGRESDARRIGLGRDIL